MPRPTSVFSSTPRSPRTDGPVTRCTHYNGSDQQFDTRVAAAQRLFFYTFLSSRIFCLGNLLITSVVRSSESATEESLVFFLLFRCPRYHERLEFGVRTSYNLIRCALLTREFRRCESDRHATHRRATVPLFLGALTFRNAF